MTLGHHITDEWILRGVTQKLAQLWVGSETNVTATVLNGEVTLVGTLDHEFRRRLIIRSACGVAGVRRVIDQLGVAPGTH